MTRVRVTVPATTCNLGPGLDSMALALELYNTVELAEIEHGLHLEVEGDFAPENMESCARLTLKAVMSVVHGAGYLPGGLRVRLENHIPAGDCLGGDVACLLSGAVAANILLGSPLTREEVLQLVLGHKSQPHAVLAAQMGGLVICAGSDDDLTYVQARVTPMTVIVVLPHAITDGLPAALPQPVSLNDAIFNIGHAALVAQALSSGNLDLLARAMRDRLHETMCSKTIPGYQEMITAARKSGAAAVAISGTGPALILFAKDDQDQIARAVTRAYRKTTGGEALSWVLPIDTQGVSISEMGMTSIEKPVPASGRPVSMPRHDEKAGSSRMAPILECPLLIPKLEGHIS